MQKSASLSHDKFMIKHTQTAEGNGYLTYQQEVSTGQLMRLG